MKGTRFGSMRKELQKITKTQLAEFSPFINILGELTDVYPV